MNGGSEILKYKSMLQINNPIIIKKADVYLGSTLPITYSYPSKSGRISPDRWQILGAKCRVGSH